jgi:hypothetical protein
MKASFCMMTFAAFSGIVLAITTVAAGAPAVAHKREDVTRSKPMAGVRHTHAVRAPPFHGIAQCVPGDRQCEVERKLKGRPNDSGF